MLSTTSLGPIIRLHMARRVLGRSLRTVDAYLVDGLLIDSGPPATASEIVEWCRQREVRQVVNTHHHEDHAGGNWLLHTSLGVPIDAPAGSLAVLEESPRLEFYRRLVWGQPKGVAAEPLTDYVATGGHRFAVIPTPGHCPDHVCFFEGAEGWLFSGDLFIHEQARYLRSDEDAHQILASLERVLALRPRLLMCSHAGFVEDGHRAVERKIAYWGYVLEEARVLRQRGWSVEQITKEVLGSEGLATRISGGRFSKRNLVASLLKGA